MTYPKELREMTRLAEKSYPFMVFHNRCDGAKQGQSILYLHWHEHFEIIVMQQGSGIFHIDSQPYEVHPGDVLFVPAGGLHVGYSTCEGDVAYVSIVFNGSLFNDYVHDGLHAKYVQPYLEGRIQLPVNPLLHDSGCAAHYRLLQEAIAEFKAKQPAYQLIVKSQLHLLFTLLARTFLPLQLPERAGSRFMENRERFKTLIAHIEKNFADKLTVDEAAGLLNLNPYHFCKQFKKQTGRTFVEYVNVCRMNEAERLLLEGELSVTEVAGKVGCDNPNYFTKVFKQYKGVTPSQVRR
ncbi:AraC-like DNA-binding protein [Paenibacillus phyllosphaerae]|uniref:AraC-like DNA-binding protein n=1 Tax=Paenibacillus phyllosphaerae TaxID=274593 RepID=A0A7W5AW95_9BACL|nr:helix-turn-helix domain-containing protein [Paenibacillus phyllosphaerae]MBB3109757.1 AraC-like DNA-binding protein [Paenibacillus phyllosphaerae]